MNSRSRELPKMNYEPSSWGALSWYPASDPLTEAMQIRVRGGVADLRGWDSSRPGQVGVPRFCAPYPEPGPKDETAAGGEFEAAFTGVLRPDQQRVAGEVWEELQNGNGGCLIEAPTGWGKGTLTAWIVANAGRTACVTVSSTILQDQAVDRILSFTDLREDEVAIWRGQKHPPEGAKVVVGMLQSLYKGSYPQAVYNRFGLLIVDEVDQTGAPEFKKVLSRFPARWRVGLSATPERRDGMTAYIAAHLGPTTIVGKQGIMPPDIFWIDTGWSPPRDASGNIEQDFEPKGGWVQKLLYGDNIRNAIIAAAAMRAHAKGRRTLILCAHVAHAKALLSALRHMGVPESNSCLFGGDFSKEEKSRAFECAEGIVVVGTKQMIGRGVSIDALDTLILACPLYDPRQQVGRITRIHDGKPTPVVVDIRDMGSPVLMNLAKARFNYYQGIGAKLRGPLP